MHMHTHTNIIQLEMEFIRNVSALSAILAGINVSYLLGHKFYSNIPCTQYFHGYG